MIELLLLLILLVLLMFFRPVRLFAGIAIAFFGIYFFVHNDPLFVNNPGLYPILFVGVLFLAFITRSIVRHRAGQ
jgi:hypothetical protein